MRKTLLLVAAALMAAVAWADISRVLPDPYTFDPQKTYRVPVVLFSFSDLDFSMDDPAAYYNRFFNEKGYNEGKGKGCVADYFRDQSAGRLNLQFDIYGPVKIEKTAKSHSRYDDGWADFRQVLALLPETTQADFSVYDWTGDGVANEVIFIASGLTGNDFNSDCYLHPSSYFHVTGTKLPGGVDYYFYSMACERLMGDTICGIANITHEFCHGLGLPDLYPFGSGTAFSTVDEWDLMDGGNVTNFGWCPPNLSAMELLYLGWKQPEELTEPTSVTGMKPLSQGGETYLIRSTGNSNEYYLLENRKQEGWDYGLPGNGLLIFHIDFDAAAWLENYVNTSDQHYRCGLIHASGKNFRAWCPQNNAKDLTRWTEDDWLRSRYLSTSAYPYTYSDPTTTFVNNSLTDTTSPAATLFTPAADGRSFMGKPITNIQLADDGTVSFDFMKDATGIDEIVNSQNVQCSMFNVQWTTIDGRPLSGTPTTQGIYICRPASGGSPKKIFWGSK